MQDAVWIITLALVALLAAVFLKVPWRASPPAARPTRAVAAGAIMVLGVAVQASAGPPAQSVEQGEKLFQASCIACHTIGKGDLVGPDLAGVTDRRTHEWLMKWIQLPEGVLAGGDAIAVQLLGKYKDVPMPNQGLSEAEAASLIAYLAQAGGGGAATQTGQQAAAPAGASAGNLAAGDPVAGKNLFTGIRRFGRGGPSCMACHSAAGIGALGGGALGPDLTGAVAKYGGPRGLAAFLSGMPTATMNAVWSGNPVTEQERADLIAFLGQATVEQRSVGAVWRLSALAIAGLVVVLALCHLVWRRRLTAVRRPMVARAARRSS